MFFLNKNCAEEIRKRDQEIAELKIRLFDLYKPVIDSLPLNEVRIMV